MTKQTATINDRAAGQTKSETGTRVELLERASGGRTWHVRWPVGHPRRHERYAWIITDWLDFDAEPDVGEQMEMVR